MGKSIFQKAADWLKIPPAWFRAMCSIIGQLVFALLKNAGQEYVKKIEGKILEINKQYPTATNEDKFRLVWGFAHDLLPAWKESNIDTLIQNIFLSLKDAGRV